MPDSVQPSWVTPLETFSDCLTLVLGATALLTPLPSALRLCWLFMHRLLSLVSERLQTHAVSWSLGHPAQARPGVGSRGAGEGVTVWQILLFRRQEASRQKRAMLAGLGQDGGPGCEDCR